MAVTTQSVQVLDVVATSFACFADFVRPAQSTTPAVLVYVMRAYWTVGTTHVYWESEGAPDFVGTGSGKPVGELQAIVALYSFLR